MHCSHHTHWKWNFWIIASNCNKLLELYALQLAVFNLFIRCMLRVSVMYISAGAPRQPGRWIPRPNSYPSSLTPAQISAQGKSDDVSMTSHNPSPFIGKLRVWSVTHIPCSKFYWLFVKIQIEFTRHPGLRPVIGCWLLSNLTLCLQWDSDWPEQQVAEISAQQWLRGRSWANDVNW